MLLNQTSTSFNAGLSIHKQSSLSYPASQQAGLSQHDSLLNEQLGVGLGKALRQCYDSVTTSCNALIQDETAHAHKRHVANIQKHMHRNKTTQFFAEFEKELKKTSVNILKLQQLSENYIKNSQTPYEKSCRQEVAERIQEILANSQTSSEQRLVIQTHLAAELQRAEPPIYSAEKCANPASAESLTTGFTTWQATFSKWARYPLTSVTAVACYVSGGITSFKQLRCLSMLSTIALLEHRESQSSHALDQTESQQKISAKKPFFGLLPGAEAAKKDIFDI